MKKYLFLPWVTRLALLAAIVMLTSCSEDRIPFDYPTHPEDWNDVSAVDFHGFAAIRNDGTGCTGCHGENLDGQGDAGSCYECHTVLHMSVHATQPNTHQQFIASLDWNIVRCKQCHGTDYAGGTSGFSCRGCHSGTGGPEACLTCHALPPMDDSGLLYGRPSGAAGAHAKHARFGCTECHSIAATSPAGIVHMDALPAEVTFAVSEIANSHNFTPVFMHTGSATSSNGSCGNVYCHSNGRGVATEPVIWSGSLSGCQSCHGVPPESHNEYPDTRCHLCHTHVDPASNYSNPNSIRFLTDSLHVNGRVEVDFR